MKHKITSLMFAGALLLAHSAIGGELYWGISLQQLDSYSLNFELGSIGPNEPYLDKSSVEPKTISKFLGFRLGAFDVDRSFNDEPKRDRTAFNAGVAFGVNTYRGLNWGIMNKISILANRRYIYNVADLEINRISYASIEYLMAIFSQQPEKQSDVVGQGYFGPVINWNFLTRGKTNTGYLASTNQPIPRWFLGIAFGVHM